MSNIADGFDSNTHAFATAISKVVPSDDIASAAGSPELHAPVILQTLRREMPKDEQNRFRQMFCGASPRSRASESVLLSAVRESIRFLNAINKERAIK